MPKIIEQDTIIRILEMHRTHKDLNIIASACDVSVQTVKNKIKKLEAQYLEGELELSSLIADESLYCPICYIKISIGCSCYDLYPEKRSLWKYLE